jgi:hypothetical protein
MSAFRNKEEGNGGWTGPVETMEVTTPEEWAAGTLGLEVDLPFQRQVELADQTHVSKQGPKLALKGGRRRRTRSGDAFVDHSDLLVGRA